MPDLPPASSLKDRPPAPDVLLAAIVDNSEDAIISKDLTGIITSWNQSAERIFGYRAEEMVGQSILRLLPRERQEEEAGILARLQRGERIEHYETVRVCKDGRHIEVSLTISPVKDATGRIVGASKIARDITGQKRALRDLAEAHEQLKRADRMKAEFISTLSHELRTPLTSIVGWLQILKEGAGPDEFAEGLEIIDRNVRAQSQLINDLLDISRIESGKMRLDIRRVDLPAVVGAAIESITPAAEGKRIRLTSAFSSVGALVMGDKNRLQQIVWNLLTNAVKFTPQGGRVHVSIERVKSHVEIAVNDSGMGIAPEQLDQIFERFAQADSSTTRRHGGLGIGLSIARHLTELHGGTIWAHSAGLQQGSTFVVNLPLLTAHPSPEQAADGDRDGSRHGRTIEGDLSGLKVLAVDDDEDSARVVSRILGRAGAEVRSARSMDEALAIFQSFAPHVLLSDIGMPSHDGYELIGRVRELAGGRRVPAVALTALARNEDRTQALRAGFQMHVAKPVDAAELVAVVRNLASLRAGAP